jgi:O-antigen/teichoic acid export membrane protein
MAMGGISGIVLARALGAKGYGAYTWAFALVAALSIPGALGADQLLMREAGITLDRANWGALRALVRSMVNRVALLTFAIAATAEPVLALAGGGLGARRDALLVALPILPLMSVIAVAQGALVGLGRTARAVAPSTVGRQAAFLALVVVAVALGGLSSSGAVALQLTACAGATVLGLALLRRALAGAPRARVPLPVAPRDWLRTSIPMGANLTFLAIDAQIGLLVVGATRTATDAGLYAAALQCMAPFTLLLVTGRLPLGSAIARLGAARDRVRLQRGLRTASRAATAICAVFAIVLIAAPGAILGLFGGEFTGGADALRILAVAALVNALAAFNGLVLTMGGHERSAMRWALACLVLDLVLCLVLVPPFGVVGAAIAALVSITMRNVFTTVEVRRRMGIDPTVIGRMPAPPRG